MAKEYSVTSAGVSAAEDRAHRMRMYFIAMTLRVLCVASLFWLRGWWILLPAIGSVVLPWFAVMVGNAVAQGGGVAPEGPAPRQLAAPPAAETADENDPEVIVIDVDPARRSTGSSTASANPAPETDAPGDNDSFSGGDAS